MRKLKLFFAACALLLGVSNAMAQKDVTLQYITNATLSSLDGWTNINFNTPVKGNNTNGYASECYAGWGSLEKESYSLTQTITLPAGHYTLVNYSFFRYGLNFDTDASKSLAFLKAGENKIAVKTLGSITAAGYANTQAEGANAFDSKMYRNALDFTIEADNTPIEIGLYGTFDLKQSWMICGMFELINNDIPATMDAPFDVTGYITNPGFEYRDMTGWTVSPSGFFGTQNNNQGFKVGGYYAEKYQGSGALPEGSMSQTLTNLPAGFYKLTANLGGNGTYIDLNGKTANWEADKDYTVGYVLAENEDLTITAGKTAEGTANWIHFDNFRLQFCGDVAAALTTLCAEVTNYQSKLSVQYYAALQNAVNGYNKTYSDVDQLLAAIDAVQALYDAADLYIEYTDALAAAQAVDQTAPMNAGVLSALQAAIATPVTMQSTAVDVVAATTALNTAKANATTSIANYAEAKSILDAANSYDDAGQALYAADETIAEIQAAYNDRSLSSVSAEQKAAATAALTAACKAQTQPTDGCDMTAYIVNPNIDGNVDGWTCEKKGNTNGTGGPLKPSNDAMEYWGNNTLDDNASGRGFDYYQTINNLPNGAYTISADLLNSTNGENGADWNGGGNAGVYGKTASAEVQKLVYTDGEVFTTYTTDIICVVDGELCIGVKNINPLTGRWFAADNFKLTYARQLTNDEIDTYVKAGYNAALAAAQALEGKITTAAWNALSEVVTANTVTNGTVDQYNTAAAAINAAVANAQPLVDPYANWLTTKANAEAVANGMESVIAAINIFAESVEGYTDAESINEDNAYVSDLANKYSVWCKIKESADALVAVNNDNADANTTLANTITADFNELKEIVVTDRTEAINFIGAPLTYASAVYTAMIKYVRAANPVGDGAKFDLTFMLTNPDLTSFWNGTWGIKPDGWQTEQEGGNFQVMQNNSVDAEDGIHKVFIEYYYLNGNTTWDNGKFNVNTTVELPVGTYTMSCYAFAKEENYSSGAANPQVYFYANDTQGSLVNSSKLTEQSISFVNDSEQDVKIGLKPLAGNTYNWMGIGYVQLFKVPTVAVTIDENVAYTPESVAGKVTLKRTLSTEKWNTFVVPFQITNEELKEAFGDGVEVAEFSEVADGNNSTVNFNKMTTPAIAPNKPVLLKPATVAGDNTYVFMDRTVATGDAKAEGTNFDFVGTYAASATIAAGDYFINSNTLYKSDGKATIKGTRAYLKAKSPLARIANFVIDDEATGISSTLNAQGTMRNEIYNLQGQRVSKAQKGLFIQNGKKVLVK